MSQCPFDDPEYDIDMNDPCPVCKALGYWPLRDIHGNSVDCIDEMPELSCVIWDNVAVKKTPLYSTDGLNETGIRH